jgi:hypothetical protein
MDINEGCNAGNIRKEKNKIKPIFTKEIAIFAPRNGHIYTTGNSLAAIRKNCMTIISGCCNIISKSMRIYHPPVRDKI